MKKTRVLIVDDSALMRELLRDIISRDPSLEVVGSSSDPYTAWARIKVSNPDVVTLDVEMPRMDGVTFLKRLMSLRPTPVVMISSFTGSGCDTTLRALEAGAVDFVAKPGPDNDRSIEDVADEIVAKIKIAAGAKVRLGAPAVVPSSGTPRVVGVRPRVRQPCTDRIVAVGASTGGTEALRVLLSAMPEDAPGIVVVQHMPERFTRSFAERLDSICPMHVREARDGDAVLPGQALIAPGNFHTRVGRRGNGYVVSVREGAQVNRHRPSVDVLFESCAASAGAGAVGVILTGMGADGARGLRAMRDAGALTIAQNEASCVVFGMPREAIALDAVIEVLPLDHIAAAALAEGVATASVPVGGPSG